MLAVSLVNACRAMRITLCCGGLLVVFMGTRVPADTQPPSTRHSDLILERVAADESSLDGLDVTKPSGARAEKQKTVHILVPDAKLLKDLPLHEGDKLATETQTDKNGKETLISGSLSQAAAAQYREVAFDNAAEDGSTLDVLEPVSPKPNKQEGVSDDQDKQHQLHIAVPDTSLQGQVKALQLKKGDVVAIATVTSAIETKPGADAQSTLKSVRVQTNDVSLAHSIWTLIICATIYVLGCVAVTLGHPLKLIISEDNRYSNSMFQMYLWFGILISTYMASVVSKEIHSHYTLLGGIAVPNNLLLLSGLSALTFAGAKGITTSKVQAALAAGNPNPKPRAAKPNFLSDLTHNDQGDLDFGDFQMFIVTLVAASMYVVLIVHYLSSMELRAATSLPDVDTTILASFGLGQGAYLTKKAVGDVGKT